MVERSTPSGRMLAPAILRRWETLERSLPLWFQRKVTSVPRLAVAIGTLVLVAAFAGQILLIAFQAGHDGARPAWFAALPYAFVDDNGASFGSAHAAISALALGLALLQSAGLVAIVAALARPEGEVRRPGQDLAWRLVPFVAAILCILALWSPGLNSSDVFGYVGLGMLGGHPFDRPAHFFTGEYAQFFTKYPLRPTIYGPLWVALNAWVVGFGSSFAGKVLALRVLGAGLLLVLGGLCWLYGRSRALTAAVLLNPMLWMQFVVNAHNDLLAVTLVVGGVALAAGRRPVWAVLPIAAAGLVKLPFLILGAVAFGRLGPRRAILYSTVAVALALAVSELVGGRPYFEALLSTAAQRGAGMHLILRASKAITALAPVCITVYVVLRGVYPPFAGWLYPALAPILFPWYMVWAVPYALAARSGALLTLLALPVLATLVDTTYDLRPVALALFALGVGALLVGVSKSPEALEPASG
jgi:hypothetical protein